MTTSIEQFEKQKTRFASLQERRTRAEALRDAERANLERTREEARNLLGTDNVEELRRLYQEGEAENALKVAELDYALTEMEQKLGDIDRLTASR
ncbi:hypothetical protein D3C71_22590 [compost metagenome]